MSAPDFTGIIQAISSSFDSIAQGAKSGWNDAQADNFYIYYVDPYQRNLNSVEAGVNNLAEVLYNKLEELYSLR